jgi:hypothetical protein
MLKDSTSILPEPFATKKASVEGNVADIDGKPPKSAQGRFQQENSGMPPFY